jgi:hypothetical protein
LTVGEVEAESADDPSEKIQPCPKEEAPVPPFATVRAVVRVSVPMFPKVEDAFTAESAVEDAYVPVSE